MGFYIRPMMDAVLSMRSCNQTKFGGRSLSVQLSLSYHLKHHLETVYFQRDTMRDYALVQRDDHLALRSIFQLGTLQSVCILTDADVSPQHHVVKCLT